jgi:alanyl-tRNA synthetase
MDFREIRERFLEYFRRHDHAIVQSSSLIPRDDPTLLFTNAGMVQFKRLFLGEEKRSYTRAATSQKCVRAGGKHNDLENVGYTARHHTFFEMLGNFSFGDYFKEEAISWAWELLTQDYGLPPERLYVSVFKDDDEAYDIWEKEIGIPSERIVRLGEKDNFWAMGDTGQCGPCSEILIDQGEAMSCGQPDCAPGCDCDRYLEIWNLVFTQFDRMPDGNLSALPKPNIDTGMGLERLCAVVQGVPTNYDTDLFRGIIQRIEELCKRPYGEDRKQDISFRVISDHARATAFLIGDGILPSNEGRGYVLRRIVRRAIRFGQVLGMNDPFLHLVAKRVIETMGQDYRELVDAESLIEGVVFSEERRFADTLHYGMKVLQESLKELKGRKEDTIPGDLLFKLYDTYGLSSDIVQDVAREEEMKIDLDGYEKAMAVQRTKSQESWKGSGEAEIPEAYRKLATGVDVVQFLGYDTLQSDAKVIAMVENGKEISSVHAKQQVEVVLDRTPFYGEAGGQVGDRGWFLRNGMRFTVQDTLKFSQNLIVHKGVVEEGSLSVGDEVQAHVDEERRKAIARNHTATHLLHAALREVLGDHVKQAGSLVAPDRLRFDFSHFSQVSQERLQELEDIVNGHILENHPLSTEEMTREADAETDAVAIFEERYGDKVRLVRVGDGVSLELCGGTHASRTGDIGLFKVVGESAVGANLRRIEALTGRAALEYVREQDNTLRSLALAMKASPDELADRIDRLLKEKKDHEREIETLKDKLITRQSVDLLEGLTEVNGVKLFVRELDVDTPKALRNFADQMRDRIGSGIVVLGSRGDGKAMLICVVTQDLSDRYKAGQIIGRLSGMVGGKGGGRADMAQGGGNKPEALHEALEAVPDIIEEM